MHSGVHVSTYLRIWERCEFSPNTFSQILFSKRPYQELENEFQVITAVEKRRSPWEWDKTVPLERILSACCNLQQESRPSMDTILQELRLILNPTPLGDITHALGNEIASSTILARRLVLIAVSWTSMSSIAATWVVLGWISMSYTHRLELIAVSLITTGWILWGWISSNSASHLQAIITGRHHS